MTDVITLEEFDGSNAVDLGWFLPFIIYRLQPLARDYSATLEVTLQNIGQTPEATHKLTLTWSRESAKRLVPPVQEHIITEWAACGIACIVIPLYTDLQILHVTQIGDSFDYWVGNDANEFGLEVSGTMRGNLAQRHRAKVKQLLNSSHRVSGYVSVTGFEAKHTILSFHRV